MPIIFIGNKSDLIDKREISVEYATELIENLGYKLFETSAKNCTIINEAFDYICKCIKENQMNNSLKSNLIDTTNVININQQNNNFNWLKC